MNWNELKAKILGVHGQAPQRLAMAQYALRDLEDAIGRLAGLGHQLELALGAEHPSEGGEAPGQGDDGGVSAKIDPTHRAPGQED